MKNSGTQLNKFIQISNISSVNNSSGKLKKVVNIVPIIINDKDNKIRRSKVSCMKIILLNLKLMYKDPKKQIIVIGNAEGKNKKPI